MANRFPTVIIDACDDVAVALHALEAGEAVAAGDHVHTHNLATDPSPADQGRRAASAIAIWKRGVTL